VWLWFFNDKFRFSLNCWFQIASNAPLTVVRWKFLALTNIHWRIHWRTICRKCSSVLIENSAHAYVQYTTTTRFCMRHGHAFGRQRTRTYAIIIYYTARGRYYFSRATAIRNERKNVREVRLWRNGPPLMTRASYTQTSRTRPMTYMELCTRSFGYYVCHCSNYYYYYYYWRIYQLFSTSAGGGLREKINQDFYIFFFFIEMYVYN
jgi:hypothetical protein